MKLEFPAAKNFSLVNAWVLGAAFFIASLSVPLLARAAAAHKKSDPSQELVRIETGFFEAWKAKDLNYFRTHIPANGVSWGEYGTFSRDQQIDEQLALAKTCQVGGFNLSDFRALQISTGAYLLTYKAEQYATCNGEKMPVHMNGSSIYVFKEGYWQAIYRAEIPLSKQTGQ